MLLRITPVFEAPWYEKEPRWPWPIATAKPFTFIPMTDEPDDPTMGSFFAGFAGDLDPPDERPPEIQLEDILEDGACWRDGGLAFEANGFTIDPSCCGDLGAAAEWNGFLATGEKPWAGHDPAPWATREGDKIVIWSDGGLDDQRIEPSIKTTIREFELQLARACSTLTKFARRCRQWLSDHEIPKAAQIHARMTADFSFDADSTRENKAP